MLLYFILIWSSLLVMLRAYSYLYTQELILGSWRSIEDARDLTQVGHVQANALPAVLSLWPWFVFL